ncbi:succinate dehydrogenase, hydrophobic membrane anchor protein [Novosphingobium aerophilum]|uniref:succinate dehydrogenase, hydrophobic membrane anchor protein n=1 Tax=Novosphingobium TaxID=165696 RepID=UPI0006C87863|nr:MULTISPECIES: succinate dehydrogenase, hydrophobic membrane anchor protein [unclassified Novosphingobium]KPH59926.1 succinate dehydrogenase [Novosphingobium sp. ST904]MPS67057.1 succinate dehydrogenase, hydrophobic membrane anchor protein [Novosphingobium sp.]TCM39920.1 succinate dehydrogenase / fumarate reductase membrane anchor subunit [Novosphingobium sp. ST904]WRT94139.1 succinate dehydrogenase, hydrophobic membrane anchor protein [Novosphingobium sp. RL4]
MGNGTSIGRVRGLGSAKTGVHHWLLQRFTAIGNLLSVLFLVVSILLLPDLSYATVVEWIVRPVPAVAMILLVVTTFWHARIGLQVVVEDYVHDHANKFACIAALNLSACAGIAFGVFCVIRLALGAH